MSIDDFVKQRAVDVAVGGSYVLPKWYDCEGRLRTFACRTKRVSPFRMIVDVPVVGKIGDRVSSYFKDFGEFQATISDITQQGFLMELEMTRERRAWMSEKLSWIEKRQREPTIRDLRDDARFVPQVSTTMLTLADGVMRSRPLLERKAALQRILRKAPKHIHYSNHFAEPGAKVLSHACHIALEGSRLLPTARSAEDGADRSIATRGRVHHQ